MISRLTSVASCKLSCLHILKVASIMDCAHRGQAGEPCHRETQA